MAKKTIKKAVKKPVKRAKKVEVNNDNDYYFTLKIEEYLPTYRAAFKPELKRNIIESVGILKKGQSIFIPNNQMNVATVRVLLKEEFEKPFYKEKDIRIVGTQSTEPIKGCRIARYL